MLSVKDLLFRRRRQAPRLAARWFVDVQVHANESYVGFYTRDVSVRGVRLQGGSDHEIQRLLSPQGRAHMRLRVPHKPAPLHVEAELMWGLGEPLETGWRFTQIAPQDEAVLARFVDQQDPGSR